MNRNRFVERVILRTALCLGVGGVFLFGGAFGQDAEESAIPEFETYRIVYEQSIFDPMRRPRAVYGSSEQVAGGSDASTFERFSLMGVLIGDEAVVAFFEGSSVAFSAGVLVGGEIGGCRVESIALEGVVLRLEEGEVMLRVGLGMRRDDEEDDWRIDDTVADYDLVSPEGGVGTFDLGEEGSDGVETEDASAAEIFKRLRELRLQEMEK